MPKWNWRYDVELDLPPWYRRAASWLYFRVVPSSVRWWIGVVRLFFNREPQTYGWFSRVLEDQLDSAACDAFADRYEYQVESLALYFFLTRRVPVPSSMLAVYSKPTPNADPLNMYGTLGFKFTAVRFDRMWGDWNRSLRQLISAMRRMRKPQIKRKIMVAVIEKRAA